VFRNSPHLKKFYFRFIITVLCIISVVVYCNETSEKKSFKIVSLSPAMTEVLFSLGAREDIVGVTTFCNYPEEARKLYKVGDFSNPSVERIVGLKPDLVIVNLPEQMKTKQMLEKLKINIFVSSPNSLNDIYKEIVALGKIIKKEKSADSLVNYIHSNIKQSKFHRKKKVYIELSARPIVTVGRESFLNELLEMAGAKNIFFDLKKEYPVVSQEEVIRRDPEIIILLHPEDIKDRLGWNKITAIKNKKIYKNLNQDYLLRPGPRLVKGFKELKQVIGE